MDSPHEAHAFIKVTHTGCNVNIHTLTLSPYSFTSEYGVARGNADPTASLLTLTVCQAAKYPAPLTSSLQHNQPRMKPLLNRGSLRGTIRNVN